METYTTTIDGIQHDIEARDFEHAAHQIVRQFEVLRGEHFEIAVKTLWVFPLTGDSPVRTA